MDDLLTRLRARNWRLTSQRRAVAQVLVGEHVHLTADEVHARAARVLPEIGRATVYSILAELVALGEVRELTLDGRARRYDPNADGTHHHLLCTRCGLILDVAAPDAASGSPALGPAPAAHGFSVDAVDVTYRGTCARCIAAEPTPAGVTPV